MQETYNKTTVEKYVDRQLIGMYHYSKIVVGLPNRLKVMKTVLTNRH